MAEPQAPEAAPPAAEGLFRAVFAANPDARHALEHGFNVSLRSLNIGGSSNAEHLVIIAFGGHCRHDGVA